MQDVQDGLNQTQQEFIYKDKMNKNGKIKLFIILGGIFLIMVITILASPNQPDERPVGYVKYNDTLHIWNEYDDYYFNATSGIQFTNKYNEYWSKNIFCGGIKLAGSWEYYCNDDLPFTWSVDTDNSTYVNVTGYRDVTKTVGGNDYTIRYAIRYNLKSNETYINIIPYEKNIGELNITVDTGFAWRVKNINVSLDTINDFLQVEYDYYNLSENRNESYTNLEIADYLIRDNVTEEYIWLNWSGSLNYKLLVNSTPSQYNAPITLGINAGTLNVDQEKSTTMSWIDAKCSWSCNYNTPSSQVDILVNATYTHTASIDYLGSCITAGASIRFDYNDTQGYLTANSTNNGNLSAPNNPKTVAGDCFLGNCPMSWKVNATEDNQDEGMYYTRDYCTFNRGQTKYGYGEYINISTDTSPPTVILQLPSDNTETSNGTVDFVCYVEDVQSGVKSVKYYNNWTNLWIGQESNTSKANETNYTFTQYPLEELGNGTEYFLTDGAGVASGTLHHGITYNGTDFWITEFLDKHLYHYNSSGDNISGGFNYEAIGGFNIKYVTSNNSDFWFVDDADDWVYHTDRLGNNQSDGFSLKDAGLDNPRDITTNGSDFWVIDGTDDWVYHFNVSGDNMSDGFSLRYTGLENPVGISTNGSDFWVAESLNIEVYRYNSSGDRITTTNIIYEAITTGMTTGVELTGGSITEIYAIDDTSTIDLVNHYTTTTQGYSYVWNCEACDLLDNCGYATANFTFTLNEVSADCWSEDASNLLKIPNGCLYTGGSLYEV